MGVGAQGTSLMSFSTDKAHCHLCCHTGTYAWLPTPCTLSAVPTSHAGAAFIEVTLVAAPDPCCLLYTVCPTPQLSWTEQDNTNRPLEASLASRPDGKSWCPAPDEMQNKPHAMLEQRSLEHPTQATHKKAKQATADNPQGT